MINEHPKRRYYFDTWAIRGASTRVYVFTCKNCLTQSMFLTEQQAWANSQVRQQGWREHGRKWTCENCLHMLKMRGKVVALIYRDSGAASVYHFECAIHAHLLQSEQHLYATLAGGLSFRTDGFVREVEVQDGLIAAYLDKKTRCQYCGEAISRPSAWEKRVFEENHE